MNVPALLGAACLALSLTRAPQAAPTDVAAAHAAANALPQLHALVVSRRGEIVFEHYAKGHAAGRLANVKSASKSLIAALVGIAIERKLIAGVQDPIVRWFPELRTAADPRRRAITIEDLLTMRSGLASTSGPGYGRWVTSPNWVRHVLQQPMVSDPGTSMEYSSGTSHLLSAILTKATGTTTHRFAVEALARPLGIALARWPRDPQGIYFGGNEMLLTPRQMIAVGELWRNDGRVKGAQVVPADWVRTSCEPRTRSRWACSSSIRPALSRSARTRSTKARTSSTGIPVRLSRTTTSSRPRATSSNTRCPPAVRGRSPSSPLRS